MHRCTTPGRSCVVNERPLAIGCPCAGSEAIAIGSPGVCLEGARYCEHRRWLCNALGHHLDSRTEQDTSIAIAILPEGSLHCAGSSCTLATDASSGRDRDRTQWSCARVETYCLHTHASIAIGPCNTRARTRGSPARFDSHTARMHMIVAAAAVSAGRSPVKCSDCLPMHDLCYTSRGAAWKQEKTSRSEREGGASKRAELMLGSRSSKAVLAIQLPPGEYAHWMGEVPVVRVSS